MNETLSERELSVVRLVAEGRTSQEIAKELCIAKATVKAHLVRIALKLHAHSRTRIAYTAAKMHMLTMKKCEMNKEQKAP